MIPYRIQNRCVVALFFTAVQARISPKPDDSVYDVVGCVPYKFHTCTIVNIFVLPDEAPILSIISINNAGPWSLLTSYLELMYRNGSSVKFNTAVIGDTNGRCTFGAKFIPYYNNSQGKDILLLKIICQYSHRLGFTETSLFCK